MIFGMLVSLEKQNSIALRVSSMDKHTVFKCICMKVLADFFEYGSIYLADCPAVPN